MQKKMGWKYDLMLFDGGDGGAGAGAAGDAGTGTDAGVTKEAAAPVNPRKNRRENPLANVKFGKQPEEVTQATAPAAQENQGPTEDDWKAAKEKYRDFFNRDTTGIVQERLKNSKQAEDTLGKLTPIMEGLAKKYGKEANDVDGIIAAYTDDDSLYEEDAMKAGMPVQAYKQLMKLQADKQAREAQEAISLQEKQAMEHIQRMITAFDKDVKTVFPDADLRAELQNPAFARLVSPEVGVSVKDAYWLIHRAEIEPQAMAFAAQKAQEKLSQSIQSGARRPVENGSINANAGLDIRSDPRKWTKAEKAEVKRRAERGEKILL